MVERQSSESPRTRRRGDVLEAAILDAAWSQLSDLGWAGFTYEAVSLRAATNKSVLYRRWPNRGELFRATIRRRGTQDRLPSPDTGTLRGDAVELLRAANERPERFLVMLKGVPAGPDGEDSITPAELRALFRGDGPGRMEEALARAVLRGEIRDERVPQELVDLPFDLFLGSLFTTRAPLSTARLEWIVDEVFMPLLSANAP